MCYIMTQAFIKKIKTIFVYNGSFIRWLLKKPSTSITSMQLFTSAGAIKETLHDNFRGSHQPVRSGF